MATNDNKNTTKSLIRISNDLIGDLLTSFPECTNEVTNMKTQLEEPSYVDHCKKIYPQRFLTFYIKTMIFLTMMRLIRVLCQILILKCFSKRMV